MYTSLSTSSLPDSDTAENIRIMVTRSINFLEKYGPKVLAFIIQSIRI